MKEEKVKQLLERYWQCETSLEEEQLLRAFFSGENNNISEDLKIYQPLFRHTIQLSEVKASKELKSKVNKPLRLQFYPILKIAASILIILTIGVGLHTRYQQENQMDRVFSDTYDNPEDAVRQTEIVVEKVSSILQLMQEQEIQNEMFDSLQLESDEMPNQEIIKHK